MASDASINTKGIRVSVQANGLIRRVDTGFLIAELCDGVAYDSLPDEASTLEEIARLKGELAEARRIIPLDDDTECDIRREERRRIVAEVDVWAGPEAWLFCLKCNLLAAIEATTP